MPFPFSESSKKQLATCDSRLQDLFNAVSLHYDCTITQGQRGEEEQNRYFAQGLSKVKFPDSKHNKQPSQAVDAGPCPLKYPDERVLADMTAAEKENVNRLIRWYHFCGYVKGVADTKGISIRQGCDWDGDNAFDDQKFNDLPHTELKEG